MVRSVKKERVFAGVFDERCVVQSMQEIPQAELEVEEVPEVRVEETAESEEAAHLQAEM